LSGFIEHSDDGRIEDEPAHSVQLSFLFRRKRVRLDKVLVLA